MVHGALGAVPLLQPSLCKALRLKIPLLSFCAKYGIADANQEKLARMEYQPGLASVEKAPEPYWKGEGFTYLTWMSFIKAHKLFLKDVRNGKWDGPV